MAAAAVLSISSSEWASDAEQAGELFPRIGSIDHDPIVAKSQNVGQAFALFRRPGSSIDIFKLSQN